MASKQPGLGRSIAPQPSKSIQVHESYSKKPMKKDKKNLQDNCEHMVGKMQYRNNLIAYFRMRLNL